MHEPWHVRRDEFGRFLPGAPGRPFGARNKRSRRIAQMILGDFEANRDEVLPRLREWFLPQYISLIARLMPHRDDTDALEEGEGAAGGAAAGLDDEAAARLMAAARVALARLDAGEGTLADLERALAGQGDVG